MWRVTMGSTLMWIAAVVLLKAKDKFNINEHLTFTDLDGTIIEEDCISDVIQMPNCVLKVVNTFEPELVLESSLEHSSTSTLTISEASDSEDICSWLNNIRENISPDLNTTDTSLMEEPDQPSTSNNKDNFEPSVEPSAELSNAIFLNVDKDGFVIPNTFNVLSNINGEVLQMFLQTNGGQHILEEYAKNGILCDRTRRDLVNITVKLMVQNYGSSLSKQIKTNFAKAIVELFPKLKDPTSSKGGYEIFYDDNKRTPSGYLAWRLRTVVRSNSGVSKKRKQTEIIEAEPADKKAYVLNVEDEREIEFLKHANAVTQKEEIFEMMRNTIQIRKKKDFNLDEFPRFLDTDGLIHQDFNILYPEAQSFQPCFEKYIEVILNVYNLIACQTSAEIDGTSPLPGWDKPTRAALALIHMLPSTAKGKKTGRRDSFDSSVQKFIVFCTAGEPLQNIVSRRKLYQPYLLAIGANKAAVHDYKVILDDRILDTYCNKFADAFDFLFKTYFVFKTKYDSGLEVFFKFTQFFFYKIPLDQDMTTKMKELMNRLENFKAA